MIVDSVLAPAGGRRPVGAASVMASVSLPPLSIRDGIARRLQLPSKLMAQHKFGTRRRAMLSFERQPFPAPCHVDQDVAHSRAWCALRHLTTFDRVLSALHRRNHLPVPPDLCTQPMLPRGSRCGQLLSRPEYTSRPIMTFAPHIANDLAIEASPRSLASVRTSILQARANRGGPRCGDPVPPRPWHFCRIRTSLGEQQPNQT